MLKQTVKNKRGESPLHIAAKAGDFQAAKVLLSRHDVIDIVDDDHCTPLIIAAKCGHVEICRLLLQAGAAVLHESSSGKDKRNRIA